MRFTGHLPKYYNVKTVYIFGLYYVERLKSTVCYFVFTWKWVRFDIFILWYFCPCCISEHLVAFEWTSLCIEMDLR